MLPIEILAYITKISNEPIALKIMSVFNIKKWELFIDMLVEKHEYDHFVIYKVGNMPHYRYGPAIEYSNGTKVWYRNGLLHRENEDFENEDLRNVIGNEDLRNVLGNEDLRNVLGNEYFRNPGPAIECANGTKCWYRNGKLHRLDGPAVICFDDVRTEWYRNGLLHREDGPAIEYKEGLPEDTKEEWYQNGLLHRGVVGNDYFRNPGPAVIYFDGAEEWYQNGLLHRENDDSGNSGPAILNDDRKEWYKNGLLHREDGPAVETHGLAEWWINGKIQKSIKNVGWDHYETKLYEDGEIVYSENIGNNRKWYRDGKLYAFDVPIMEKKFLFKGWIRTVSENGVFSDRGYTIYYQNGFVHREDGPAIIYPDGREEWYQNGLLHRGVIGNGDSRNVIGNDYSGNPGPAVIWRGQRLWYNHGKLYKLRKSNGCEEYYENNELHRLDGPAIIYPNGDKEYYEHGKLHRENGPAMEYSGGMERWYKHGKLHRIGGPAIIYSSGIMEWYQNGKLHRLDGPANENICSNGYYIDGFLCLEI